MAPPRPRRRTRPDGRPRAGRDGLRRGRRASPITGLYATIVPLTAYAIFGPSRVLVLGPDSSLAGIIAAVVLPLAARPDARDRARRDAVDLHRHHLRRGWSFETRLRYRSPLQTGALWVHPWHRR